MDGSRPAGWYRIGEDGAGLYWPVQRRPRWLTRKLLWWLLEIDWIEAERSSR